MKNMAFWLTQPTFPHVEIAHDFGFRAVVLDIEHGTFNLDDLDRLIPFCKALGMKVYAKVSGPTGRSHPAGTGFWCRCRGHSPYR